MWDHGEMMVQRLTGDVSLSNGTVFSNTLTIDQFNTSSVGNYTCTAKIGDNMKKASITISLKREPYLSYLVLLTLFT